VSVFIFVLPIKKGTKMEIKTISDWSVTQKLHSAGVNKKTLYEAIMSGDLIPEPREGRNREWHVREDNIDAYIAHK
jgi:hypothetical protein